MKEKIIGVIVLLVFIFIVTSGLLEKITAFFTWLFMLQYNTPETSVVGEVIVRVLTFAVSYSLVGFIFNLFKLFDKKGMSIAYFIFSSLLGFVLAYIVMIIEKYLFTVLIVFSFVFCIFLIASIFINRKKNLAKKDFSNKDN